MGTESEAAHVTNTQNRTVVVSRHGDPDVLTLIPREMPEPAHGQVRIRTLAAGVSAFDLMYRRWAHLPGSPKVPFALGEDIVGLVDAVGPDVDSLRPGEMVAGGTWSLGVGGGYAEYVCLPSDQVVRVPSGVDAAEAVCLVVNYLTAQQHLHEIGRVRSGERLLVHGAAGGVGTAVLQLGAIAGLEMYGTASAGSVDVVAELGATPIDYRDEDFVERIAALTDDGVDVVIDPIGGGRHLWRSHRTLRRGGRLVWLGSSAVETKGLLVGMTSMATSFALRMLPGDTAVPRCPTMDQYAKANNDWYRDTLAVLLRLLAAGRIHPVVAERIPLPDAARAHELLEEGGHPGKFVLVTDAHQELASVDP